MSDKKELAKQPSEDLRSKTKALLIEVVEKGNLDLAQSANLLANLGARLMDDDNGCDGDCGCRSSCGPQGTGCAVM